MPIGGWLSDLIPHHEKKGELCIAVHIHMSRRNFRASSGRSWPTTEGYVVSGWMWLQSNWMAVNQCAKGAAEWSALRTCSDQSMYRILLEYRRRNLRGMTISSTVTWMCGLLERYCYAATLFSFVLEIRDAWAVSANNFSALSKAGLDRTVAVD